MATRQSFIIKFPLLFVEATESEANAKPASTETETTNTTEQSDQSTAEGSCVTSLDPAAIATAAGIDPNTLANSGLDPATLAAALQVLQNFYLTFKQEIKTHSFKVSSQNFFLGGGSQHSNEVSSFYAH